MEDQRVEVVLKATITKKRKHTCEMSGPEGQGVSKSRPASRIFSGI